VPNQIAVDGQELARLRQRMAKTPIRIFVEKTRPWDRWNALARIGANAVLVTRKAVEEVHRTLSRFEACREANSIRRGREDRNEA